MFRQRIHLKYDQFFSKDSSQERYLKSCAKMAHSADFYVKEEAHKEVRPLLSQFIICIMIIILIYLHSQQIKLKIEILSSRLCISRAPKKWEKTSLFVEFIHLPFGYVHFKIIIMGLIKFSSMIISTSSFMIIFFS